MICINFELTKTTKLLKTLHSSLETTVRLLGHDLYLKSGKIFG